jgi:hypothetical protein
VGVGLGVTVLSPVLTPIRYVSLDIPSSSATAKVKVSDAPVHRMSNDISAISFLTTPAADPLRLLARYVVAPSAINRKIDRSRFSYLLATFGAEDPN